MSPADAPHAAARPPSDPRRARFTVDAATLRRDFDRVPFPIEHDLQALDLFHETSLRELCERYEERDYFVASSAQEPGNAFYSVEHGRLRPHEALANLDSSRRRILLKRPENYDTRFRRLLDALFEEVVALRGGLGSQRVLRLESAIFISSSATITPCHFDPEISFFFQIAGRKTYHLFPPSVLGEADLERFYIQGIVDVGPTLPERCDASAERIYRLEPGHGFHQPQNSPHWVETGDGRSISYSFVFETDATRAVGRTRAFNHYMRRARLAPAPPGAHPSSDRIKADVMGVLIPLRKRAGAALKRARR